MASKLGIAVGLGVTALLVGSFAPAPERVRLRGMLYDVPRQYQLSRTFAAAYVAQTYQLSSSPNEAGLVFPADELAGALNGYVRHVQGAHGKIPADLGVVVRPDDNFSANLNRYLRNILPKRPPPGQIEPYRNGVFGRDRNERVMWKLTDRQGGWMRTDLIPPGCYGSEGVRSYDSCLFVYRLGGMEISFHLHGENVAVADAVPAYVLSRLAEWKAGG